MAPLGEDAMPEIRMRAPREIRLLLLGLLVSVGIFVGFYWDIFGVVNQKLVLSLSALLLIGTVDYFQKEYVFRGDSVARRVLFRWYRYPLPRSFTVHREPSGAIVITNDENDDVLLAIGRDMVDDKMAKALKELYQYSAESTFEIG